MSIRIAIFDDMPVYAHGLSQVLGQNGMTIVGIRKSYRDTEIWRAVDVAVVALPVAREAMVDPAPPAWPVPHLLLVDQPSDTRWLPLEKQVHGHVQRTATVSTMVAAVRAVARGGYFREGGAARPDDALPVHRSSPLSSREHQVLNLITQGLTHSQIAKRLGISRHTVDTYIRRIRTKWALGNTAELTRAALLSQV